MSTEIEVDKALITPYLPPGFRSGKGSIVQGGDVITQSPAIDRVICCLRNGPPLIDDEAHSVFPIESAAGAVEITMRLDATKLRADMEHLQKAGEMRTRRYLVPVPGSKTTVSREAMEGLRCRAWIIGLPSSPTWGVDTIAQTFTSLQDELKTMVHGLYVLGIGFFVTDTSDMAVKRTTCIPHLGDDRFFRFGLAMRSSLDRWSTLPAGWAVDLKHYLPRQQGAK